MNKLNIAHLPLLVAAVAGLSTIAWLTNTYVPNGYTIGAFFFVLFLTAATLAFSLTDSKRRASLVAGGVVGFMLLRLLELREPIYLVLLLASLLSLEVYLRKR